MTDSVTDGDPINARKVGDMGRLLRWCGRNPAITSLAVLSLVAILGIVGFFVTFLALIASLVLVGRAEENVRAFRVLSPSGWLIAIVLFFLPWADVRCNGRSDTTMSGAQWVLGGSTKYHADGSSSSTLIDLSELRRGDGRALLSRALLLAYLIGLGFAVLMAVTRPRSARRACLGVCAVLVLIGLLLTATLVACDARDWPTAARILRAMAEVGSAGNYQKRDNADLFTSWYYASYLAHGAVLTMFLVEFLVGFPKHHVGKDRAPRASATVERD